MGNWRRKLLWSLQISPDTFRVLGKALKKLNKDWDFVFSENSSIIDFGLGIQGDILYELGYKLKSEDYDTAMRNALVDIKFKLPHSEEIKYKEALWIGLEEGVDTAILGIELENSLCLVIEGAPARPSFTLYKGKNKLEAISIMKNRIEEELE
jgi:hypothetical protein